MHLSFVVFETIKILVDEGASTLFRAGGCSIYVYQITKYFCNQPKATKSSLCTFCIIQKLDRESSLVRALPPIGTSNPPTRATGRGNYLVRARNLLQNFHQ
jgi:hypothetical protein